MQKKEKAENAEVRGLTITREALLKSGHKKEAAIIKKLDALIEKAAKN
jgi:hypothetical protein